MIRSITATALALTLVPLATAVADDVGGGDVIQVRQRSVVRMAEPPPKSVSSAPPPFMQLRTTSIAAGIGARFGEGVLLVEGIEHPFTIRGLSLGDVGIARIDASGEVSNLVNPSDIEGRYVAVEAGAAAGRGASALTMRNEKGVVVTLRSGVQGLQLTLGAEALSIELR